MKKKKRYYGICEKCIVGKNCPGLCDTKIAEVKSTCFGAVKKLLGENVDLEVAELTEKDRKRMRRRSRILFKKKGICRTCNHPTSCDELYGWVPCEDKIDEEQRGPKYGRCKACLVRPICSKICQERLDEFLPEARIYNNAGDVLFHEYSRLVWDEGIRAPQHSKLIKQLTKEAQSKPWFRDWKRYVGEKWYTSWLDIEVETF